MALPLEGFLSGGSDSLLLSASLVAARAFAAMLRPPGEVDEEVDGSFLKNRLPVGRSFVSSLRENAPSLAGGVASESGGEWSLRKDRPYASFWRRVGEIN